MEDENVKAVLQDLAVSKVVMEKVTALQLLAPLVEAHL